MAGGRKRMGKNNVWRGKKQRLGKDTQSLSRATDTFCVLMWKDILKMVLPGKIKSRLERGAQQWVGYWISAAILLDFQDIFSCLFLLNAGRKRRLKRMQLPVATTDKGIQDYLFEVLRISLLLYKQHHDCWIFAHSDRADFGNATPVPVLQHYPDAEVMLCSWLQLSLWHVRCGAKWLLFLDQ